MFTIFPFFDNKKYIFFSIARDYHFWKTASFLRENQVVKKYGKLLSKKRQPKKPSKNFIAFVWHLMWSIADFFEMDFGHFQHAKGFLPDRACEFYQHLNFYFVNFNLQKINNDSKGVIQNRFLISLDWD